MDKIYNPEIKEKFLMSYDNEDTRKTIRRVFNKSHVAEDLLEKDLYDFNESEISKVMKSLNPHSLSVSKSIGGYISAYISWAIKNGFRKNNLNPMDGLDDNFYKQFIDTSKKIHWSEDEFLDLVKKLYNPQDQALLTLIFNGIMGEDFVELKELKKDDVNWKDNEVYIKRRDEKIKIPDYCMEFLDGAVKQKTYYIMEGNGEYREHELFDSDYVFRNMVSKRINHPKQLTTAMIYNRFRVIKEYFDLEYFTPNAIKQSGMIKMAVDLWKERGKLTKEEFALIGQRFNLNKINIDNYEYYNKSMMKMYINEENIRNLYGLNVQID